MCFWTGANYFSSTQEGSLQVKFDGGSNSLPLSETCFQSVILPTKYREYADFKKNMDIALRYGLKGFTFT